MPSATIAVGDVTLAQPEKLFSAEGAKRIGDQLANLLSAQSRIDRDRLTKVLLLDKNNINTS